MLARVTFCMKYLNGNDGARSECHNPFPPTKYRSYFKYIILKQILVTESFSISFHASHSLLPQSS